MMPPIYSEPDEEGRWFENDYPWKNPVFMAKVQQVLAESKEKADQAEVGLALLENELRKLSRGR